MQSYGKITPVNETLQYGSIKRDHYKIIVFNLINKPQQQLFELKNMIGFYNEKIIKRHRLYKFCSHRLVLSPIEGYY